jgi:quercetin dioxygenase-like cupin family protein
MQIETDQGLGAAKAFDLINDIKINPGAIVSKTLRKSQDVNLTLFAFDAGQGLSGHSSPMDAYVQILEGNMEITIGEDKFALGSGEVILMPAMINHALDALESSKMLLTMVRV